LHDPQNQFLDKILTERIVADLDLQNYDLFKYNNNESETDVHSMTIDAQKNMLR